MDIKEIIKKYGYSITEVAQILGVTQQSISKSINSPNIGLITLRNIAKAINIPLSELIQKIENEPNKEVNNKNTFVCPYCGKSLSIQINKD